MDNYKPNSHKSKAEQQNNVVEKKVEKVIAGQAKTKKNDIRKLKELFISDDIENVRSYLLLDVIVPTVKDAIIDIVRMALFGSSGNGGTRRSGERTQYVNFYGKNNNTNNVTRAKVGYSYEDVIVPTRQDAEEVVYNLNSILDDYKLVSVADLYELVGVEARFTDNNYGWSDLRNVGIERVNDGYLIRMPRVSALK